jgi:hypothetical protein
MASRKKYNFLLNPYNINNYNKFLITLDKNAELNKNEPTRKIEKENTELEIDKLLEMSMRVMNKTYEILNKPNFIGKSDLFIDVEVNDPNIYQSYIPKIKKQPFKRIPTPNNEIENDINIKTVFVNIDEEIKSVSDILKLIETYKLEPNVK